MRPWVCVGLVLALKAMCSGNNLEHTTGCMCHVGIIDQSYFSRTPFTSYSTSCLCDAGTRSDHHFKDPRTSNTHGHVHLVFSGQLHMLAGVITTVYPRTVPLRSPSGNGLRSPSDAAGAGSPSAADRPQMAGLGAVYRECSTYLVVDPGWGVNIFSQGFGVQGIINPGRLRSLGHGLRCPCVQHPILSRSASLICCA